MPHYSIAVIARQKLNGLGEHWGVRFPDGSVAHYTAEGDFQIVTHDGFAQGKAVKTVREVPIEREREVYQRLGQITRNPRRYHLTDWNCESFANWLTSEKPVSQQVGGWAIFALVGLAIAAARA
jgi:NC domain.